MGGCLKFLINLIVNRNSELKNKKEKERRGKVIKMFFFLKKNLHHCQFTATTKSETWYSSDDGPEKKLLKTYFQKKKIENFTFQFLWDHPKLKTCYHCKYQQIPLLPFLWYLLQLFFFGEKLKKIFEIFIFFC